MCPLCTTLGLNISDKERRVMLLGMLEQIQRYHPWEYKCAPMSQEERCFYDMDSPIRRQP